MTSTKWLSAEEQVAWRAYLESTRVVLEQIDRGFGKDMDLSHPYYEVLVRLSEAPGRQLRMSELAENSMSSRSRLSHAVSRMEERGWIERRDCEEDRRGQWAELTDIGFGVLAAAAPQHVAAVRRVLLDGLTPEEFLELGRLNAKVRDHVLASRRSGEGSESA